MSRSQFLAWYLLSRFFLISTHSLSRSFPLETLLIFVFLSVLVSFIMALFKLIRALAPAGLVRDQVDNTQASGTNPIHNFPVKFLGNQVAENSCSHRDLGFTGHLRGKWYTVYGDTLWCAAGISDPTQDTDGFHGMVRDSVSVLTDDPLVVHDLNLNSDDPVAHQTQFVAFNDTWTRQACSVLVALLSLRQTTPVKPRLFTFLW